MRRINSVGVVWLLLIAGIFIAIFLTACGGGNPPGTTTEKEHEARKTTTTTSCSGTGTKRTCKPTTKTKPECWELEIKDSAGEEREICVDEREWNKWNVGDRYPGSK